MFNKDSIKNIKSENEFLKLKLNAMQSAAYSNEQYNLERIISLQEEVLSLTSQVNEWKRKYADELQKRLELAKMVEELENDN